MQQTPFLRSWVDWLIERIEALPGPTWLFYIVYYVVFGAVYHAVIWAGGNVPFPETTYVLLTGPTYAVYPLALYHFLKHHAARSLALFRPAWAQDDTDDYATLLYRFTHTPWWIVLLLPVAGLIGYANVINNLEVGYLLLPDGPLYALVFSLLMSMFFVLTLFSLLVLVLRQLLLVNESHRKAANIDLFDLGPAHAFSKLTVRAAVGILFLAAFIAFEPDASLAAIVFLVVLSVLAFAVFVVPLFGMYVRLNRAKDAHLTRLDQEIRSVIAQVETQTGAGKYAQTGELGSALGTLNSARGVVDKIPTLPWDTGTLSGFLSSVLLPIGLWVVYRLLERFLSF